VTITGRITKDKAECPDNYIEITDPYSVDTFSRTRNYSSAVDSQWRLCPPAGEGENTVFQSFLNVIKIREKTGPVLDNFLIFQAKYSVMKETNLARRISFIKSRFVGAACTEVRITRMWGIF
jgi:hypothetical protein